MSLCFGISTVRSRSQQKRNRSTILRTVGLEKPPVALRHHSSLWVRRMFRSLVLTGSLLVVASDLIRAQTVSVFSGAMVERGSATLLPAPIVLTYAEEIPVFPGGDEAFYRYLKAKIHCPVEAEHLNLSATVYVRFVVDEEGRIRDAPSGKRLRPRSR